MAEETDGDLPTCLVVACQYGDVDKLSKDITKQQTLPEYDKSTNTYPKYIWSFETKYYTCSVRLSRKKERDGESLAGGLEAIILIFSPDETESWSSVQSWWSEIERLQPPVRLLVCETCSETSNTSRLTVQQWCVDNEFELIQLNPEDLDDEEEIDVDGVKRILQVLHAHTWPNLALKENPDTLSPYMKQLMEDARTEKQQSAGDDPIENIDLNAELGMDAEELAQAIHDDGADGVESFEKLFSKLHLMKEKAEGLSHQERKAYAEKVALSFWKAIGGSDEEDSD